METTTYSSDGESRGSVETQTPGMSEDQRRFTLKVRHAFEAYYNATVSLRNDIYEANEFIKGGYRQWTVEDRNIMKAQERPILSFNAVSPIVNFIDGYMEDREQDYRAFPRGTEAEQLGRLMTAMMKYSMDINQGRHVFGQWRRRGLIASPSIIEVGHGYARVDDLLNGEISFDCLPPSAWYCEVGARAYDRNDAQWMGKLMWMHPDVASRKWPKNASTFDVSQNRDWTTQDPTLTGVPEHILTELFDSKTGRVRILQHWYRVPVEVTLLVNTKTGEVERMDSEKDAEARLRDLADQGGKMATAAFQVVKADTQSALVNKVTKAIHPFADPEAAGRALDILGKNAGKHVTKAFDIITRPTTALRVAHLTGWQLLDDKPSPYGSDWRYPFVPFICYQDDDDYLGIKGVVQDLKDAQREINWHHATMLDSLVRGPKSGFWIPKGMNARLNELKREVSRPGALLEYPGGLPPVPIQPEPTNPNEMEMLQFGIEAIMRISGVNAEMMGQTTQKTVSGRAIQARQGGGLVGIGSIMANWSVSKRAVGELILRRIQQFYPLEKMDLIIGQMHRMETAKGPMGIPQQVEAPPEKMFSYFKQLKEVDMDIVVDFQESSPTARQAVMMQLMQLKAAGAPIPMEIIVEASDVPYKETIKAALAKQGEQPPNPELAKTISAGQGGAPPQPSGVNTGQ